MASYDKTARLWDAAAQPCEWCTGRFPRLHSADRRRVKRERGDVDAIIAEYF